MDISVIIVSYNVRYYLRQCLDSVWASAVKSGLEVEVFVVDNDSVDMSVGYLRSAFPMERYPNLHFIANRSNVGFGRANNQALRHAKGKYVLFLNPDTIIGECVLGDCFTFAEKQDCIGGIGVKMLCSNGTFAAESRRGLPTPWVAFCKMSGLSNLFPKSRTFGKYYMRYLDKEQPAEIEILSGAFMFCSREALDECGAFDEQFFMYGEDIDLSYRFLKAGRHNWYLPTRIMHYKGESTVKGSYRYVHIFYQAMLIFFRKHFPTASFALSLPVTAAIVGQACLALIKQQYHNFIHYIYPSRGNRIVRVTMADSKPIPESLLQLVETWNLEVVNDSKEADVVVYDGDRTAYNDILVHMEQSDNRDVGIYYESRRTLMLSWQVCN